MPNTPDEKQKNWQWLIEKLLLPVLIIIIGSYISTTEIFKKPKVTVVNRLALPIIVTINDSYNNRIQPGDTQTITLFSNNEFPVSVKWRVQRNKTGGSNEFLGEEIGDEIRLVDKGTKLTINNAVGLNTYFYPVIINDTDSKCAIILNDGLSIKYNIGASSPHATTNITGYYKYAANTNVTLKCGDVVYFYGKRNGKQGSPISIGIGSGVVQFSIPRQSP